VEGEVQALLESYEEDKDTELSTKLVKTGSEVEDLESRIS